jgi:hemerythrin
MTIVWRIEMSIDDGIIDADHKCLIGLVNEVDAVPTGPAMPSELAVILAKLDVYARLHFGREERLQVATGFTYASAHRRRHGVLLRDLDVIRAEFKRARGEHEMEASHACLCDFLHHWLSDHILKADRLMKPFVSEMRLYSHGSVPLARAVELSQDRLQASKIPVRQLPLPSSHR